MNCILFDAGNEQDVSSMQKLLSFLSKKCDFDFDIMSKKSHHWKTMVVGLGLDTFPVAVFFDEDNEHVLTEKYRAFTLEEVKEIEYLIDNIKPDDPDTKTV